MEICQASALEALINATPDGGVCQLEQARYYLARRVVIRGKKNVTVEGNGAEIVTKYVNSADFRESADAFLLDGCCGVTLQDLSFDTDVPPNVTATVEALDVAGNNVTVRVDPEFPMKGNEVLMAFGSVDEEGSFDYRLHHYAKHPDPNIVTMIQDEILVANTYSSAEYEYLGDNRFHVWLSGKDFNPKQPKSQLARAKVGDRVCIRHTMYGPSTITIRNSDDTVLKNITMYATAGMGVMVLTRCQNLTIDGFKMVRRSPSVLMSCNCDGLHVTGLGGKLILRNCEFDGLGDDALNIHSTAGTATAVDTEKKTVKCNYCKKRPDGELPAAWCQGGDRVRFFNPETLTLEGELLVEDFTDGILTYSEIEGTIKTGYVLQSMAFNASCEVENCTVRNTRARAFLFQVDNVEVKNCTFFGMSSCAIKAAPDLDYWFEVGPVDGLYIHHNRFVKNGFRDDISPTVALHTTHNRGNQKEVFGMHKNIRIEDNVFERVPHCCVEVIAADGVSLCGNTYPDDPNVSPVALRNCQNVCDKR